jgi:tetratricopeptide (TPR) repeat protein
VLDAMEGANSAANPLASFASAESKLTKALSVVPDHPIGHTWLGLVEIWTKRASQGIAKCEHALELNRNLALAHFLIGYGKLFLGRPEETESHIGEALRLSPRDAGAYAWLFTVGVAKLALGSNEQAIAWLQRSIDANRNFPHAHFFQASALVQLDRLDDARAAVKVGLALNPAYTMTRDRTLWTWVSNDPKFLDWLDLYFGGLRRAGAPE